jgi:hypothetical protein
VQDPASASFTSRAIVAFENIAVPAAADEIPATSSTLPNSGVLFNIIVAAASIDGRFSDAAAAAGADGGAGRLEAMGTDTCCGSEVAVVGWRRLVSHSALNGSTSRRL